MRTPDAAPELPRASVVNVSSGDYDVYVGRRGNGKWGNPFHIGPDGNRADVIAKYRDWIQTQPQLLAALPELVGKRLACHCHPQACHGDVLAELANELAQQQIQTAQLGNSSPLERGLTMEAGSINNDGPLAAQTLPAEAKVLVCGSRDWPTERAHEIRARIAELPPGATIIAGGARGADKLAEEAARELGYRVEVFPANWETDGRSAGYKRNLRMLDQEPDLVIAFRVGESRGTQHTVDNALARGLDVEVYDELTFVESAEIQQAVNVAQSIDGVASESAVAAAPAPAAANDEAAFLTEYRSVLEQLERHIGAEATQYERAAEAPDLVGPTLPAEHLASGEALHSVARRIHGGIERVDAQLAALEGGEQALSPARQGKAWLDAYGHTQNALSDQAEKILESATAAFEVDGPVPAFALSISAEPDAAVEALRMMRENLADAAAALQVPTNTRALARQIRAGNFAALMEDRPLPDVDELAAELAVETSAIESAQDVMRSVGQLDEIADGAEVPELAAIEARVAAPEALEGASATQDQLDFLERLYVSTGEDPQEIATKAAATKEIDRLLAVRENIVTDDQKQLLRDRCEREGVPYEEPQTRTEFKERLRAVSQVTADQTRMLRRLSMQLGRSFQMPADSFSASTQIDALVGERERRLGAIEVSEAEIDRLGEELNPDVQVVDEAGNDIDDPEALTREELERHARIQKLNSETAREARREAIDLSAEIASTGAAGIGVPFREDEIVRPSDLVSDEAEERFRQLSPEDRARYQAGVAEGTIADFGGAPGSEAEWAYGGSTRPTLPTEQVADWQRASLTELAAKRGVSVPDPTNSREATRMIRELRGDHDPASQSQLKHLSDIVGRLSRGAPVATPMPQVETAAEARKEISRLSRQEHALNPEMKPSQGQLKYLDDLLGQVSALQIGASAPGSAIQADRMIDQLHQLRREDPDEQVISRELMISSPERFESLLGALRPNEQAVLRARYREGLSVRETSFALQMQPHDVERIEFVGRDKFRRGMELAQPSRSSQPAPMAVTQAPQAGL